MTNELIKVQTNQEGEQRVSARELYKALAVSSNTRFSRWFETNSTMFVDGLDFTSVLTSTVVNNGATRQLEDFLMTVEMAKHIAMMSGTDKGAEVRNYFIEVEKRWNSPEAIVARALEIEHKRAEKLLESNMILEQKVAEYEPKATYYDKVLSSTGVTTTSIIAADYGMSATKMNKKLHEMGIQYKQGNTWLLYQKYKQFGYTKMVPVVYKDKRGNDQTKDTMKWTPSGRLFIYEQLKKEGILPIIERD